MIKFGYTILYVDNVEEAITFYEKAFGFERIFITPDNQYGELKTGETTLSFASTSLAAENLKDGIVKSSLSNKPFAMEIAFVTEDIKRTLDKAIEHGAVLESNPKDMPHGQTVAYVRDPNGFLIEICTPVKS
jgi:uncharacterized glyoxalase superfamily protein PhnB